MDNKTFKKPSPFRITVAFFWYGLIQFGINFLEKFYWSLKKPVSKQSGYLQSVMEGKAQISKTQKYPWQSALSIELSKQKNQRGY